ncbi:MAG: RNA polymerase sigma factor [Polyangiaceae bacterium]
MLFAAHMPELHPSPSPPFFSPDTVRQEAALLEPVVRAVVAAVLREGRRHPDVDDCTNEALRRALEGAERLRAGEPVRPWIVGIARHVALDSLRAKKRKRQREVEAPPDSSGDVGSMVDRVPDAAPSAGELIAVKERDVRVREAIDRLAPVMRDALVKFHLEGKSYVQIAEEMKVPLGSVATWVTRGRKLLAEELGPNASDGRRG